MIILYNKNIRVSITAEFFVYYPNMKCINPLTFSPVADIISVI